MFCAKCGNKIIGGARFCVKCGTPVENNFSGADDEAADPSVVAAGIRQDRQPANQSEYLKEKNVRRQKNEQMGWKGKRISNNITLCEDGKYRWIYEMNLFTNPTVFFMVWKIFFFIFLGIFFVTMIVDAVSWDDFFPDRLLLNLKFLGYFCIGMTVVTGIGYLVYAIIMGGKYIVEFEMDEKGINHKQIAWQAEKAKKIGSLTTAAGLAGGNLTTAGIGMNSARTEMYSDFGVTRKVKAYPLRRLIKVNGLLSHNQVYTAKEDFEFVKNFILSHCNHLK